MIKNIPKAWIIVFATLLCIGGTAAALAACGPIIKAEKQHGCFPKHLVSNPNPVKGNPTSCYPYQIWNGQCQNASGNTEGCSLSQGWLRHQTYTYSGSEGNCQCTVNTAFNVQYNEANADAGACP